MATSETEAGLEMGATSRVARVLGAMFLVVVATSLAGGTLLSSTIGTDASEVLGGAARDPDLLRAAVIVDLATSIGIVALAGLLYVVLRGVGRSLAVIAFGLWLIEAMLMVVSRLGALSLATLAQASGAADAADPTSYKILGETIYEGIVRNAYSVHMLFYCAGGLLWYSLFYRSAYLPRAIPLFGLVAVILALAGTVLQLLGTTVPMVVFLPLFPFELLIGGWLVIRGIETDVTSSARLGPTAIEPHGA